MIEYANVSRECVWMYVGMCVTVSACACVRLCFVQFGGTPFRCACMAPTLTCAKWLYANTTVAINVSACARDVFGEIIPPQSLVCL